MLLLSQISLLLSAAVIATTPPIRTIDSGSKQGIVMWYPDEVNCEAGTFPQAEELLRPFNTTTYALEEEPAPASLTFAIDDTGRPHSIDFANGSSQTLADAPAALAGSRFRAGASARNCTISYEARTATFEQAPFAELVSLSISPEGRRPPKKVWERIYGSSECMKPPRPRQLVRVMPDFAKIPGKTGARDWTLIGYDIDEEGRTQSPKVIATTGSPALDEAGIQAVDQSRFAEGAAKTGCLNPFWRNPLRLAAPHRPEGDSPCDDLPDWDWSPNLRYPAAFQRRLIEGWALIRYDVASWGETGNVEVIDAQPASAFGVAAMQMMQRAKYKAAGEGATGCTTLVAYVLPEEDGTLSDVAEGAE